MKINRMKTGNYGKIKAFFDLETEEVERAVLSRKQARGRA